MAAVRLRRTAVAACSILAAVYLLVGMAAGATAQTVSPTLTLVDLYLGPANAASATTLTPTIQRNASSPALLTLVAVNLTGNPELAGLTVVLPPPSNASVAASANGTAVLPFTLAPTACPPSPAVVAGFYQIQLTVASSVASEGTTVLPALLIVQDLNAGPRGLDWCGLSPVISITQDDGPNANAIGTLAIAQSLYALGVPATFFLTGLDVNMTDRCIRAQTLVAQGHTVGTHTFSHPDITQISDQELLAELVQNDAWIRSCLGIYTRYFRPPYGRILQRQTLLLSTLGFSLSYWTETVDNAPANASTITYFQNLYAGHSGAYASTATPSIITDGHDYNPLLPTVYKTMVPYFTSLGYTFVTYQQCATLAGVPNGLAKDLTQMGGPGLDRAWPYTNGVAVASPYNWTNPACAPASAAPVPTAPAVVVPPTAPPPLPQACILEQNGNLVILPNLRFNGSTCVILYDDTYSYLNYASVVNGVATFAPWMFGSDTTFFVEGYVGANSACTTYINYFSCTASVNTTVGPTLAPTPPAVPACVVGSNGVLTVTPPFTGSRCVDIYTAGFTYLAMGVTSTASVNFTAAQYGSNTALYIEGYSDSTCVTLLNYFTCQLQFPSPAPTTPAPSTPVPTTAKPTTAAPTTVAPTTAKPTTVGPTSTPTPTATPACVVNSNGVLTVTPPFTGSKCVDIYTTGFTYLAVSTAGTASVTFTAAQYGNNTSLYIEGYSDKGCVTLLSYFTCQLHFPTSAPTTPLPSTPVVPTTSAPTTAAPTTPAPTTTVPTTAAPTTAAPTTATPTTVAPTTAAPTPGAPTTTATPTTVTAVPTSVAPTTAAPTTSVPSTPAPTTATATPVVPTTAVPTTAVPTTAAPTTAVPTTVAPTTAVPTTAAPTTAVPTTVAPTTVVPTTTVPTTAAPSTPPPTTTTPTTAAPTTAVPTTVKPTTAAPTTAKPTTASPTTAKPTTVAPTTAKPTTATPTTAKPTTVGPTSTPTPTATPACVVGSNGVLTVTPPFTGSKCIDIYTTSFAFLAVSTAGTASVTFTAAQYGNNTSLYIEGYSDKGCVTLLSYFTCQLVFVPLCAVAANGVLTVTPPFTGSKCIDIYTISFAFLAVSTAGTPSVTFTAAQYGNNTSLYIEGYSDSGCVTLHGYFTCQLQFPTLAPTTATPTTAAP